MGRTTPTYRDRLDRVEREWRPYRRALRRADRSRFDELLAAARDRADAAGHLNHADPLAPVWMAVALEQQRRLDELRRRVDALDDDPP
jgi:hypothetical protein